MASAMQALVPTRPRTGSAAMSVDEAAPRVGNHKGAGHRHGCAALEGGANGAGSQQGAGDGASWQGGSRFFVFDTRGEGSHDSASQEEPVGSQGSEHVGPVSGGCRSRVQAVPQRTVEETSTGQGSSGDTGGARPHRSSTGCAG